MELFLSPPRSRPGACPARLRRRRRLRASSWVTGLTALTHAARDFLSSFLSSPAKSGTPSTPALRPRDYIAASSASTGRLQRDRRMRVHVVGCSPAWPNPGGAQSGYPVRGRPRPCSTAARECCRACAGSGGCATRSSSRTSTSTNGRRRPVGVQRARGHEVGRPSCAAPFNRDLHIFDPSTNAS